MTFSHTIGNVTYAFANLRELLAKATPPRSGDQLVGLAAASAEERVAAQFALADLPLAYFLSESVVPYEHDEVTRLILDTHDPQAFAPISGFTVGDLRDWLLSDDATAERLAALAPGLTPEMAAAVSKLMRVQDLILAARKIRVVTRFRTTVGLPGRLSARLQPTTPPTIPWALPHPFSMASFSAPATPSSASIRQEITSPRPGICSSSSTAFASVFRFPCRVAFSPTSPRR